MALLRRTRVLLARGTLLLFRAANLAHVAGARALGSCPRGCGYRGQLSVCAMRRACFVAVVAALHAASAPGAPELFLRDWAALNAARGRNMFTGEVDDLGWGTPNPPAAVCAPHAL